MSELKPTLGPTVSRDKYNNEPRALVRVVSASANFLIYGTRIPVADREEIVEIPESEIETYAKFVRNPELERIAEESLEKAFDEFKKENQSESIDAVYNPVLSLESEYSKLTGGRPCPPLRKFEVIERGRPAPLTREERKMQQLVEHVSAAAQAKPSRSRKKE